MITNARLVYIQQQLETSRFGQQAWNTGFAVDVRCLLVNVTTAQRAQLGSVLRDSTLKLVVQPIGIFDPFSMIAVGTRVVVYRSPPQGSPILLQVELVEPVRGGLAHLKAYCREQSQSAGLIQTLMGGGNP